MSLCSILSTAISEKNGKALEAYKVAKMCFHLADHSTGWYWLNEARRYLREVSEIRGWIEVNNPA